MLYIIICIVFFLFLFIGFKLTSGIISVLGTIALFIFTPWFTIPVLTLIVFSIIAYYSGVSNEG